MWPQWIWRGARVRWRLAIGARGRREFFELGGSRLGRHARAVCIAEEEVVEPLRIFVLEHVRGRARKLQPRRPCGDVLPGALLEQVSHAAMTSVEDADHLTVFIALLGQRVNEVAERVRDGVVCDRVDVEVARQQPRHARKPGCLRDELSHLGELPSGARAGRLMRPIGLSGLSVQSGVQERGCCSGETVAFATAL